MMIKDLVNQLSMQVLDAMRVYDENGNSEMDFWEVAWLIVRISG